ncbi:MAG: YhbY family RNA-binding protein [Verrucomicrobia bacterium]|nr:YhbY family RNA-binding protein [Verrucomicrobiota bacterium]
MTSDSITTAEKIRLRGLAMNLKPSVFLGKDGPTAAVIAALDKALNQHGLVKVRSSPVDRALRKQFQESLAAATESVCVGATGHTASYFRPGVEIK